MQFSGHSTLDIMNSLEEKEAQGAEGGHGEGGGYDGPGVPGYKVTPAG